MVIGLGMTYGAGGLLTDPTSMKCELSKTGVTREG